MPLWWSLFIWSILQSHTAVNLYYYIILEEWGIGVCREMKTCILFVVGLIHVGDEIKEVNGIPVDDKKPEEIIHILVSHICVCDSLLPCVAPIQWFQHHFPYRKRHFLFVKSKTSPNFLSERHLLHQRLDSSYIIKHPFYWTIKNFWGNINHEVPRKNKGK